MEATIRWHPDQNPDQRPPVWGFRDGHRPHLVVVTGDQSPVTGDHGL